MVAYLHRSVAAEHIMSEQKNPRKAVRFEPDDSGAGEEGVDDQCPSTSAPTKRKVFKQQSSLCLVGT